MPKESDREASNLEDHTILIVDDDIISREIVARLLARFKANLHFATNGLHAIDMAKRVHPDMIIMDILMPVMDGLEAIRQLREIPKFRDTPIITLSSQDGPNAVEASRKAGSTLHVGKPISFEKLSNALEQVFG